VVTGLAMGFSLVAMRTGLADHALVQAEQSPQAAPSYLAQAVRYRPDVADNWRREAESIAFDDPARACRLAERATQLAPNAWQAWATLGLIQLQRGDVAASRQSLAQAVQLDRGFDAHFQLAGLALMQSDMVTFHAQIRSALAVAPLERVDDVLREIAASGAGGDTQLLADLPVRRPEVMLVAVHWLLNQGQVQRAAGVWPSVGCPTSVESGCRDALHDLLDRLVSVAARQEGAAQAITVASLVQLWNQAVETGVLRQPHKVLGEITDGSFRFPWFGPNLSWEVGEAAGANAQVVEDPVQGRAVEVNLPGDQADQLTLFHQFVPLQPATCHILSYGIRRIGSSKEDGVTMAIKSMAGQDIATQTPSVRQDWSVNQMLFSVPTDASLVEVSVEYRRPLGEVRLKDQIRFATFQLHTCIP